jgi:hypothetical protein
MIEPICRLHPFKRAVDVTFFKKRDGLAFIAHPLTMVEFHDGSLREPTISLSPHEAQMLMDQLWQCGMRPTEGTGSAGSLAATERHLKDMREIAFGLLKNEAVVAGTFKP